MNFLLDLVGDILTGVMKDMAGKMDMVEKQTGRKISPENREIFDMVDDLSWSKNDYRKTAFQNTGADEDGLYTCAHCGRKFPRNEMDADHIIPKSCGGSNSRKNLQLLCRHCNRSKQNKQDDTYNDLARREREIEKINMEDAVFLDNMRNGMR